MSFTAFYSHNPISIIYYLHFTDKKIEAQLGQSSDPGDITIIDRAWMKYALEAMLLNRAVMVNHCGL